MVLGYVMVSIGVVDDGSLCHSCRGWHWCYGVSTRSFVPVSQDLLTLSRAVTLVSGLAEVRAAQPVGDTAGDRRQRICLVSCATSVEHKGFQVSPLYPWGLRGSGRCLPAGVVDSTLLSSEHCPPPTHLPLWGTPAAGVAATKVN